jgi:hypothetical protein
MEDIKFALWFGVAAAVLIGYSIFSDFTQRRLVDVYRRFGTTYRVQSSRVKPNR